jgi:hypothetical protein
MLVYSVLRFSAEFLTILNKQTAGQRGFPDIYMLEVYITSALHQVRPFLYTSKNIIRNLLLEHCSYY